jgi:PAS domain S-box-containing protein
MKDTMKSDPAHGGTGVDLYEELTRLNNELAVMHRELAKKNCELARERENLLHLFDALPEFVCLLAQDYSFRYANQSFKRLFGDPAGRPCYECMRQQQAPCEACPSFRVFQTSEPEIWEWDAHTGRHYLIHDIPYVDRDGSKLLLKIGFDITRRKQAEEALKESTHILTEVQHIAHIATWTLNTGTGELRWSDEIYNILGLPAGSPLSMDDYMQCIHSDDFQTIQDAWSNSDPAHSSIELEYRLMRPDGDLRYVHEYSVYTYAEDGEVMGLATMLLDITGRKQVEAELRVAQDLLSEAQNIAHLGTWSYNSDTNKFSWSDELYRIFGLPVGRAMSYSDFMQHVHPDDYEALVQAWTGLHDEKLSVDFEYRIVRPDGEERSIHEYSICANDGAGQTLNSGGILLDITERIQAEQALQAKNAELERFSYAVSHDLRSPLVTIRTFMRYLAEDISINDSQSIAGDMDLINTAAEKMEALLAELLQLSRVGRVVNQCVTTPLQEIVQESLALVAGRIAEQGVRVEVTDGPVGLFGDRVRLVEVFQNLIDNAVKFMGGQPEPLIEIGAETKNGEIMCFVRDNGMGIDPQQKDKLFGLFARLNSGIEGTGLGLALVKRIVEIHGGRFWVESEGLGKGACFWFTLPRKSSEQR